mmetsp:Transcript_107000/g.307775  ORF Transcript_107000/g.307775 Transcript_107000/m.307775 type:complete len:288 (-) Transcript_107000:295-1158(-)
MSARAVPRTPGGGKSPQQPSRALRPCCASSLGEKPPAHAGAPRCASGMTHPAAGGLPALPRTTSGALFQKPPALGFGSPGAKLAAGGLLGLLLRRLPLFFGLGVLGVCGGDRLFNQVHRCGNGSLLRQGQGKGAALEERGEELDAGIHRDRRLRASIGALAELRDSAVDPMLRELVDGGDAGCHRVLAAEVHGVPDLLLDLRAGDEVRHLLRQDRPEALLIESPVICRENELLKVQLRDAAEHVAGEVVLDARIDAQQEVRLASKEPLPVSQPGKDRAHNVVGVLVD